MGAILSVYDNAREIILKQVMSKGSFSISEICTLTGLSTTSIAKYVSRMVKEGLIDMLDQVKAEGRGRRAVRYGAGAESNCFLGVDVSSYSLGLGVMDLSGEMRASRVDNNFRTENTHECLELVLSKIREFLDSQPELPKISSAHFNLSGRVNSRAGTSASSFSFEETLETPLSRLLSERLGVPVYIANDTQAMAYGEYHARPEEKWENMLFVNAGWGLGLGIIIGGKLYAGGNGYAGEIGHMHMFDNNILCHCGKKGCLETEVSGRAISRKLSERIKAGESSVLSGKVHRNETITTDDIILALEKEDPLCMELVSRTGSALGMHLSGIMNLLNPDAIVIGGSLSRAASYYFLQYAALAIKQHSLKLISSNVPVVSSVLGNSAGLRGACLLARDRFLLKESDFVL